MTRTNTTRAPKIGASNRSNYTKNGPRLSFEQRRAKMIEAGRETLQNATTSTSTANYETIFAAFIDRGIAASEIAPRENVFTYAAWLALDRQVRKGEKGVKVISCRTITKENEDGSSDTRSIPTTATVFHISQTDPISAQAKGAQK